MAKVILVPPPVQTQEERSAAYGQQMTYPVSFSPPFPKDENNAYIMPTASVSIPKVEFARLTQDPMITHVNWHTFGRRGWGRRAEQKPAGSPMMSSIHSSAMRTRFWDHEEIEQFVAEHLKEDLLVQHDPNNSQWVFYTLNHEDYMAWTTRLNRPKAPYVETPFKLRRIIENWCYENVTEYDIVSGERGWQSPDYAYVREPEEALFFKMRWTGVDVEAELEESAQAS